MGEQVRAGNVDFWVDRRGQGPERAFLEAFFLWV
jgi:hypothetical protein